MSLISLIVGIAVIGLLLWAITALIPMDGRIKNIIYVVAIVFICLYVLQAFGLLGSLNDMRIR